MYMSGTYRGPKRATNSLELELQMKTSCHVGDGNAGGGRGSWFHWLAGF